MKNTIIYRAVDYISSNTGIQADSVEPLLGGLSPFLDQLYRPYVLQTALGRFVLIEYIGDELVPPGRYEKHFIHITKEIPHFDGICVVFESLPFYLRQRYAQRSISFVVPGKQLNWPQLGLALQQRSRGTTTSVKQDVSPATQLLLLFCLLRGLPDRTAVSTIADRLGYSTMTISRAIDQLEAKSLGQVERIGRERVVTFDKDRQASWVRIAGILESPVARQLHILPGQLAGIEHFVAGETALAEKSTLAAPPQPVYAVSLQTWQVHKSAFQAVPVSDETTCTLQVWKYAPGILAETDIVDPFSLWLSMREVSDDRVQIALDELRDEDEGWKISQLV